MPFDLDATNAFLGACDVGPPEGGWPAGAPERDFTRSPAAARVGRLAAESHLFLFHYEYRVQPDLPEDQVPDRQPELAEAPRWEAGVLPERKYQSFRHDLPIGGFNPGHRAKWTAHELCHALVGFGWREDASTLYLATAARLAELLPVVLWYFLDEAWLRRCPVHEGSGALFRTFCPDCEAVASPWPDDPRARERLQGARRFLDRELGAIARTRRLGRPVPHLWATLDLASDGVAYAEAHGARLRSEAFRRFADGFLIEGRGFERSLDALEARVVEVARAIGGEPLAALADGPEVWIRQDLGWRLWSVWHETEGEAADGIAAIAERLAAGGPIEEAVQAYRALEEAFVLPDPADLVAVGYPIPGGGGRSVRQIGDGIASFAPLSSTLLDLDATAEAFEADDAPVRRPLPERFASWYRGPVTDLVRWEAALATIPPGDAMAWSLGPEGRDARWRLADGMRVLRFEVDVVETARAVEFGDVVRELGRLRTVDGDEVPLRPTALVLGRDPGGEVLILDVSLEAAAVLEGLGEGAGVDLPERGDLVALGVLVPAAWEA